MQGPTYDYTNELAAPSEIGVREGGSAGAIIDAMGGVAYYVDALGFGQSTKFAANRGLTNRPLGLQYFLKTGMKCSNGADMYEYIDNIPKGLPGRPGDEAQKMLGVKMRGLAPGIVEDAASALNPLPLFKAAMGSGYSQCKKVTQRVGDSQGKLKSNYKGTVWIEGPVEYRSGIPYQTRWVHDKDVSAEEYEKTPKIEAFANSDPDVRRIAAGVLLAAVAVGVAISFRR